MFWCEIFFLSKSAARFSLTSYRFFFSLPFNVKHNSEIFFNISIWTINVVFDFFVSFWERFKNHMRIFSRLDVNQCLTYYCWSTLDSINWILYAEWLFRLQRFSVIILGVQQRIALSPTIYRRHRPLYSFI